MMTQPKPHFPWHPLSPKTILLTAILTGGLSFSIYAQISIPAVDVPLTEDFNNLLSGGGSGNVMPPFWVFLETGAGSNGTYAVDAGATSTENTYSYGTGSATERALGQINTATFTTTFGASLVNNTGVTITSLLIQYVGEQWRLGAAGRTDRIDFQYSTDATAINNGTWTNFDGLDFTAPIQAGVGALDGNASANRTQLAKIITGLSLANGATIWIRWNSFEATGNDDGLAIDDFALTANPPAMHHYTVSNNGVTLSITDAASHGEELEVSQIGTNIRFFASGRTYSLNAGATTAMPVDVAIAGLSFIVINAGTGNDTINVGAFTTNLPGLTINGGIDNDVVNMNGDISFLSGSAFNADLQNDNASPGVDVFNVAANANITCAGTGIATIKASSRIVMNSLSSVATANGSLTVEANQQVIPTTGDFNGIELMADAWLQATGTGVVTIKGRGGDTGTINYGIYVHDGGEILGGTSGTMTIIGTGGPCSGSSNAGVAITQSTSRISSGGANVNVTGTGGGVGSSAGSAGILMNSAATITAGGNGTVTVTGTGAAMPGTNFGLSIANDAVITSTNGNVSVTGFGGGSTGGNNYGVYLWAGGTISAGGVGTVTVNGTGGASSGNANDGVSLYTGDATITSSGGDVMVTGQGGGTGTSGSGVGVHLQTDVAITAGGLGDVTVTGTGGATIGANNFGIFVIDPDAFITSNGGNVTLIGQGGGSGTSSFNYGIVVFQGLVSAGGTGTVSLTGTGGASTGSGNIGIRVSEVNGTVTSGGGNITLTGIEGSGPDGYGISVYSSGTITTETNGGSITLIGNSINIAGNVRTNNASSVSIRPYTNGVDMFMGPATNIIGGPLHISDAELDFVTTLTIFIGNSNTGDITVSSPITRSALTHVGLVSGDHVILDGGNINSNGGNVLLDSGPVPDQVRPLQAGNDLTCGIAIPAGALAIVIDGTVADVSYTQLNVIGGINLNSASLTLSGTYDPQPGDVFTIVVNDGADAITGTFSGLPQGATIASFLGSDLPATISYTGGTGNDIILTVGAPDYIITNGGGILTVVDFAGNGETMAISHIIPNIRFDVAGRTYSLNGGAVTNMPYDNAIAGLTSITVDVANGNDLINVGAFTTNLPSLTLNGGTGDETINFTGAITFAANASLDVDLQNDDPTPGTDQVLLTATGSDLAFSGNGSATIKVSRNITFTGTASIITVNGALTLEANQQTTPTTGTFLGISLTSGSLVQATGTGVVTLKGKGGTSGGSQRGIECVNCDIIGGTSGTMTIEGIGGATGTAGSNDGIRLFTGGSVSSSGAHITITGTAGGTGLLASSNSGVNVSTNGVISVGGAGNLNITANGGPATAVNQFGFQMGNGSSIITNSGNIIINGYGGDNATGASAFGVSIAGGTITAGGMGTVLVNGEGGAGTGNNNYGVTITTSPAAISSSGGAVTVTGVGGGSGASSGNVGVSINTGALITAGGSGTVSVGGTGGGSTGSNNYGVWLSTTTSIIRGTAGTLTVLGQGGGVLTSANNIGVYCNGTITSNGTGSVFVQGWGGLGTGATHYGVIVDGASAIITSGGGLAQVVGSGGLLSTSGNGYGVFVTAGAKIRSTGAGNTTVIGSGGGAGSSANNYGVHVLNGSEISAAGTGNVSVTGTGGVSTGIVNGGVVVTDVGSLITSSGGAVTVSGFGGGTGTSTHNFGVYVQNNGKISAGSTGVVTVNGTGGATTGNFNYGVVSSINNASITSGGGNVFISGQGGGTGASAVNIGVDLQQTGTISAGGSGNVTVNGIGGNTSGDSNHGVLVWFDGSYITSGGGDVTVTGQGGGSGGSSGFSTGVNVDMGEISAAGGGDVNITGYGSLGVDFNNYGVLIDGNTALITSGGGPIVIAGHSGGSASSYGINLTNNAEINTVSDGGSVHLAANSMHIGAQVSTDPAYYVWLSPLTNGMDMNLGTIGDVNSGPLNLSDQELDSVSTGYLLLGSSIAGDITTTANITRTSQTIVSLHSTDDILINAGSINTAGGDLSFIPGAAPDASYPLKAGTDVICNTFYPIGPIEFDIDGMVADVNYTQMNVTGAINLEDASLQLTGSHIPQAGESFIIINNDGADAVVNTFVGLAEGATITSFLGGIYPATISYVGGTGNDVVITVASPHYILTTSGNEIIFTDVAGNGETITVSQDGINSVMFTVPGRNYSLNGGAVTALPVSTSLAAMNMVTVNAAGGNDGITVNAFTANMCHLTLNGGIGNDLVTMNGDIPFASNANLNIDLQDDDPTPGEDRITLSNNTNLPLAALGAATLKCSRNVIFGTGSSLTTVNGNLIIEANQQATPTSGTFYGILLIDNSLVEVTGAGVLDVKGKGGDTGIAQIGVYLYNAAILRGGPTGDHTVLGTGGLSPSNDNRGIQVQLSAIITTNGGNLVVSGQGAGTGTSNYNHGIHLVQSGVITAGGMGTVTVNATGGFPTGIRNHGIHIYGAGSGITSGGGDVFVYGLSGGTGPSSSYNHGVFVEEQGIITAGGLGIVTVEGTGGNAEGERNDGVICFRDGAAITSGGGDVHVTGIGGGTGASFWNYGVFSDFGGEITAGGMGDLYVTGTGGATTGTRNTGVYVYQPNASITTSGGDLHITGQGGGSGASTENFGVHVHNGAMVKAGGAGNVFVNGTGGTTTGTRNDGVCVEGDTAIITSSGGDVEIIGQGNGTGVAFRNYGVFVNNTGIISAGGTGAVNIQGTGSGTAEGVRNYGVVIAVAGSMITSSGGSITVTGVGGGTGPASNNNFGTYLTSGSIIAQGDANISIEGTGGNASGPYNFGVVSIGTSTITTANGNINIVGQGGGVAGSTDNNGIRMDAVVMAGGNGHVNVEGYGGTTTGINNYGFVMDGGLAEITTNAGNITVFGQGFGSGGLELGVYMGGGAQIISGGMGTTTVEGIGGHNAGATNFGVYLQNSGTLISSSGGDVNVTGQGGGALGNGSNNYGIDVVSGAMISAGGVGNVTLDGTGGESTGSNNYGVVIYNGAATVSSSGGDIHIMAQGGGTGAGGSNIGFHLQSTGMIAAGGTGDILIEGNGGAALGNGNHGTLIFVNGTSVTTVDGDIEIIGTGGGIGNSGSNIGIEVNNGTIHAGGNGVISLQGSGAMTAGALNNGVTIIGSQSLVSTSNGDIAVIGIPGSNTNALGILHSNGSQIHTTTGGGNIALTANSMDINATIETLPADTVFITSFTMDTNIVLGAIDDSIYGPLMLSDTELDSITTGTLMIGKNSAGSITVIDTITREVLTVVNLTSGGNVIFDGGMLHTNGGNSKLDPGISPAGVKPLQYGTDISCGNLTFGSDLIINIDGTIPDTTYDQLNASGVVNLTGVSLVLTGTHMPAFSDTFTIVVNDGVDPIIGTFSGLPEGGSIPSFLGGSFTATISYVGGDGNDVVIYVSLPDYLITNVAGHLEVTDMRDNGDAMVISENGANFRFHVVGRNYSYNFGPFANLPADVALAGLDSITVNAEGGNDTYTINAFVANLPNLTINGGVGNDFVSFAGDITFKPNADLNIDLQNDDPSPGIDQFSCNPNVDVSLIDSGNVIVKTSGAITFASGSTLDTEDGNIVIEGNYQGAATTGLFHGISVNGGTVRVSGGGALTMKGRAGVTNNNRTGIQISNSGDVIGGTSGIVTIEGSAVPSAGTSSFGISLIHAGSTITSGGADIDITGFGGGANAAEEGAGIYVNFTAAILAGGNGTLTMTGTGGAGSGNNNNGLRILSSSITTTNGDLTMTGTGGSNPASGLSMGVQLLVGTTVAAGGIGNTTVYGTGVGGSGSSNIGVTMNNVSIITSGGGDVSVTGIGGGGTGSNGNRGVNVTAGATITAAGAGNVFVSGTGGTGDQGFNYGVDITDANTLISSAGGFVNVIGQGGGTITSPSNYGVYVSNAATINAGALANVQVNGTGGLGSGGTNYGVYVRLSNAAITSNGGNITVTGQGGGSTSGAGNVGVVVEATGNITAGGEGEVTVSGSGGLMTGTQNHGVVVNNTGTTISSNGGDVTVTGEGGGSGPSSSNYGVSVINGAIVSPGGNADLVMEGAGGLSTGNFNYGINVQQANSLITSNGGHVNITGTGGGSGSSQSCHGINITFGGRISAGGPGNVLVNGYGGSASGISNTGVFVNGTNSTINSNAGNVIVNGTGGTSATTAGAIGVSVISAGKITAGGNGTVTVTGQAGANSTSDNNVGVQVNQANSIITSSNGSVSITGIGGGTGGSSDLNYGVSLLIGGKITSGGIGNVTVDGTGGPSSGSNNQGINLNGAGCEVSSPGGHVTMTGIEGGGASGYGMLFSGSTTIATLADVRNVTLNTNSILTLSSISANSTSYVMIRPVGASVNTRVGSIMDPVGGPLGLSDTELDLVQAGRIIIGSNISDTVQVETDITRAAETDIQLFSASSVIFNGGEIQCGGGDLFLTPGNAPAAIRPLTTGTDAVVDTAFFENDLAIRINGITVDVQYDQFNASGSIDLNEVDLELSGSYVPMEGDSFIIVLNDGVDPIISTFNGLAEGDTIFSFLGSTLDAVITYTGNTGNDVVIRIPITCLFPDVPVIAAMPDTICEGTEVTLNIVAGDLGAATEWHWYAGSCGGISVGTGNSIMVTPITTTTYYARGEGGCVTSADCGEITVVVNPFPDASIDRDAPDPCYFADNIFQPEADEIPGASYQWHFGAGAQPLTAMGYGPHTIIYTTSGPKTAKLVIHPNAPGMQCPDSTTLMFVINSCPGQILGSVMATNGAPINNVNVKLFADANTDGMPDTTVHIRSVFTPANGQYAMASLLPGSYVLVETQPNLWISHDDGDSTPDGDLVANSDSLDNVIPVTLFPNEVDSFNIFVERPEPGTITGTVFQDFDLDQVPDPGEGIEDVLITIYADANTNGVADNNTPIDTAHTNSLGNYTMTDVQVGHYVIVETQPPGMNSIKDFDPSPDGDVVPNTNMNNDTLPVSLINAEMDNHNYFIDVLSGCALVVTNTNDAGPGTFRDALDCAMPGDTVRFHASLAGDTIEITSNTIVIQEDVIVKSDVLIVIRSSINDLIAITPGVDVEIRSVHLVSGLSPSGLGAAIDNHGQLLLHNTQIKPNPLLPSDEYLVRNHPGGHIEFSGNNVLHE